MFKEHKKLPQTKGCQNGLVTSGIRLLLPALELLLVPIAFKGRTLPAERGELCSYPAIPPLCVKGREGGLEKKLCRAGCLIPLHAIPPYSLVGMHSPISGCGQVLGCLQVRCKEDLQLKT